MLEQTMLEQLYPLLIVVGATIGVVMAYLWRKARRANDVALNLIRLNEQLLFDTPAFLRAAWPLLSRAGLQGFEWKLDWFGTAVEGRSGQLAANTIRREVQVTDMKLAIIFQQNRHGEGRYFDEALIETFMLLLRTDMWIKAGATDATFAQMSKLTLFMQHDMKNVAQFIQLMADQLATLPAGKELQVLEYLRTAAPLIRHRADRIVRTLTAGQAQSEVLRSVELVDEVTQICKLYQLDCRITGSAQVRVPAHTLDSALDNILKNYSDLSIRDPAVKPVVSIGIADDATKVRVNIEATGVPAVAHVERLFEPFWSSDPAGLGIGLYQAKQMLEACGGKISATQNDGGQLSFCLELPKNS
ncbi:hypothetical protein BH11PSE11_BH11PSE11_30680 [soil metagenome]